MGIEDFRVAPDNKGGRPTKEEQEEDGSTEGRVIYGDPSLPGKGKEEWEEALETLGIDSIEENLFEDETIGSDHIGEIANYAHLLPWDVRIFLEAHGIYKTDWWSTPEDYPSNKMLSHNLRERGVENDFTRGTATTESGEELTGGWAELINDAKDS